MKNILLVIALLILSGCNPNIQLRPSEWLCTKIEQRDSVKYIQTGKFPIVTNAKTNMCVQWSRVE